MLYGKGTLVKIHWQILFNRFLCSVWTLILCHSFFDKYSLPKKHCSWELSINRKIAIATAEHLCLSRGILKTLLKTKQQRWSGFETSTKVVVYTNKCICPGNIWWVFIIRVNMRANIIWQRDFGKDSLTNFI